MLITRRSQFTGIERTLNLNISQEEWDLWDNGNGPLIQKCFPRLLPSDREFILTGITEEEWEEYMADEDAASIADKEEEDKYLQ